MRVLCAQRDERYEASAVLVKMVFLDINGLHKFVVCVLDEGQYAGDLVAVFNRRHISLDLCSEICSSSNQQLAQAGSEENSGRWWNLAFKWAFVDDVENGGLDGAKVVWSEPVEIWEWLMVEAFVGSWVEDEAAEIHCASGSPLLMF